MDEERLKRIIQAVTMAVMVALVEAHGTEEEQEDQGPSFAMLALVMMLIGCVLCKLKTSCAAAVLLKKLPPGRREKEKEEKRKDKKKKKKGEKWLRSLLQAFPSSLSRKGRRRKRRSPKKVHI